jgi:hypothetical protein
MAQITAADRSAAQHLPDAFRELSDDALSRVVELVTRYWDDFDAQPRARLAEALLPLLEKLLDPDAGITEEDHDLCEGIVGSWIFRRSHRSSNRRCT